MRSASWAFVVLAVLLASHPGIAATGIEPHESVQGVPEGPAEGEGGCQGVDAEGVRKAVDTYFRMKAHGCVTLCMPDLSLVMEPGDSRSYEEGRLSYSIECWRETGVRHESFCYRPQYESIVFAEAGCAVLVRPVIWLRVAHGVGEYAIGTELHRVSLFHTGDGWKVREDQYVDDFTQTYPRGTDFQHLLVDLRSDLASVRERDREIELRLASDPRSDPDWAPGNVGVMATYVAYDRIRAAQYGMTYTNNDGSLTSTTNYNTLFRAYNPSDCQNFVCQCIWYGFGGVNDYAHISGHLFPMIGDGPPLGTSSWWSDGSSTVYAPGQTYDWPWVNVGDFFGIAYDQYLNNKIGVQAVQATSGTVYKGDYVATATWSHVLIIVNCIDANSNRVYEYSEIWVSAHTANRQNVLLASLYPSPSSVVFVRVVRYRDS